MLTAYNLLHIPDNDCVFMSSECNNICTGRESVQSSNANSKRICDSLELQFVALADLYNIFQISQPINDALKRNIQLTHISSLWQEIVKRIDGEMTQYEEQCYICYCDLKDVTPIKLECCGLALHYHCLKKFVDSKFKNHGQR